MTLLLPVPLEVFSLVFRRPPSDSCVVSRRRFTHALCLVVGRLLRSGTRDGSYRGRRVPPFVTVEVRGGRTGGEKYLVLEFGVSLVELWSSRNLRWSESYEPRQRSRVSDSRIVTSRIKIPTLNTRFSSPKPSEPPQPPPRPTPSSVVCRKVTP